jgi:hypothetical protein
MLSSGPDRETGLILSQRDCQTTPARNWQWPTVQVGVRSITNSGFSQQLCPHRGSPRLQLGFWPSPSFDFRRLLVTCRTIRSTTTLTLS